jgi:hypothetical protein
MVIIFDEGKEGPGVEDSLNSVTAFYSFRCRANHYVRRIGWADFLHQILSRVINIQSDTVTWTYIV